CPSVALSEPRSVFAEPRTERSGVSGAPRSAYSAALRARLSKTSARLGQSLNLAAAAGFEPAPFSVTARCPTIGPHRKQSPRQDSNLRSPAPKAGALTRLRHSENPTAVAMAGLEPALSWFRTRRALRPTPQRA